MPLTHMSEAPAVAARPAASGGPIVEVRNLATHFTTREGVIKAVDGVSFDIRRGKTLCVVGESGSGKSQLARSLMQLVSPPGAIVAGSILLRRADGTTADIAGAVPNGRQMREIRGKEIGLIFQEPMTSLSPVHPIGGQVAETVLLHFPVTQKEARERAIAMLDRVGIPKPADRYKSYPFELSGGMRQRVCIAMALVCHPSLLIADEPTTALDVTTQANILDLIHDLQTDFGMSVMFITHDLGVVAEIADEVMVMYLGKIAETGAVDDIFDDPKHPYTQALLRSIPRLELGKRVRLEQIAGTVPHPFDRPVGCEFSNRCDQMIAGLCDAQEPPDVRLDEVRAVRCFLQRDNAGKRA